MKRIANTEINVKITAQAQQAQATIDSVRRRLDTMTISARKLSTNLNGALQKGTQAGMNGAKAAIGKLSSAMKGPLQAARSLTAAMGPLGVAVAVAFSIERVVQFASAVGRVSDSYALMQSRLKMINDGTQTQAELLNKVYGASNKARSSYTDVANVVSKLGILAKDAFSSNDEMIFFATQMNKQFQIGGASIQEQTAAMYQLTQAMAAGRLQGDEFRSIMENAPLLAQAISQEMGVPMGTLKELSSKGLITADIIKNAMIHSAEETNQRFAELPKTFSSVGTQLSNDFFKAFEPVLSRIGALINSEFISSAVTTAGQMFQVMAVTVLGSIDLLGSAFSALGTVISATSDILQGIGSIFVGLIGVIPALLPLMLGIATYALLIGTNYGIATVNMIRAMGVQAVGLARQAVLIAGNVAMFTAYTGGVLAVAAAQVTLAGVQALLSASTYKVLGAIALESAAWVVNTAKKVASAAVMGSLRIAQLAWNAVQAIGLGLLGAYNVGLAINQARLIATRAASLAASGATAVFSGAMALLNAIMLGNPIPLVIAGLVAIAGAFAASEISANGFGATMSKVWSSIVHTTTWAINQVISLINSMIKGINAVGSKLAKVLNFNYNGINEISQVSAEAAQNLVNAGESFADSIKKSFDPTAAKDIEIPQGGGGGYAMSEEGKGGKGRKNRFGEEAKRVHKQISDAWAQMFATREELADRWLQEELEKLEESRANNIHYEKDKQMLLEMYSKKRLDAIREEAQAIRDAQNKARDLSYSIYETTNLTGMQGGAKMLAEVEQERKKSIDKMLDDMQNAENTFAAMNEREKAAFLDRLRAEGTAFAITQDGMLSLAKARADQEVAINEEAQQKIIDIRRQGQAIQADIDMAINQGRADLLNEYLTSADYAQLMSFERQKEYMNSYIEAFREAHTTMQDIVINTTATAIDSLGESISGLLRGTMSIATAFQNLGKAVSKSVSDMVANMIAARLKQWLFGKAMMAQEAAVSAAIAQAQVGPWSQLALEMSMATWGASATAGKAAYAAAGGKAGDGLFGGGKGGNLFGGGQGGGMFPSGGTFPSGTFAWPTSQTSTFAFPQLRPMASGGLAYGDTFALIGEGKYPEAVLPLSEAVFTQIGEGIHNAGGGGGNITLNISAVDAPSFGQWLRNTAGGQELRQYLVDVGKEFASDTGVW